MLYMRISIQNIVCSRCQMNTCHTSFSCILWAYDKHIMSKWSSRASDQFRWLVSKKKTEAVNAYLMKNNKGQWGGGGGGGARGHSHKQSEGLDGVVWVYKIGLNDQSLQWQSLENISLSVWERQRTGTRALKLYFTRIVVLGSVKNPSTTSPCEVTDK